MTLTNLLIVWIFCVFSTVFCSITKDILIKNDQMEEINAFPVFDQVEVENITENIKFRPRIIKNIEYLPKVDEFPKYERDKENSMEQQGFELNFFPFEKEYL